MPSEREQYAEELYLKAGRLNREDRARFLKENAEPGMRLEIERRLQSEQTMTEAKDLSALKPGTRFGHYEIQKQLGLGGFGRVYLAQDTVLQRPVAIKVLIDSGAENETSRKRFAREASATSALSSSAEY